MPDFVSRRDLLKGVGLAGAGAVVPTDMFAQVLAQVLPAATLVTLSPEEGVALDAIVARLIPSDANGPGAAEARAARYIDRALRDALASFRDTYRAGLAAVDAYARAAKGAVFSRLSPADQDAVLTGHGAQHRHRFRRRLRAVLQPRACAHDSRHVLRSVLRRQRSLRRLGSDRLSRHPSRRSRPTSSAWTAPPQPTHMSAYDFSMFAREAHDAGDRAWPLTSRRPTSSSSGSAPRAAWRRCRWRRPGSR